MIVSVNSDPHRSEFNSLINSTISQLNVDALNPSKKVDTFLGRSFEPYVKDLMTELSVGTPFENSIELIGGQKFPDIVAKKFYGVEVKTTTQNHWKTTGNSVLEGTRVEGVERIYMLFAKLASPIEIRCRPYEEVLSEVVVTHSPRYLIDMNLEQGKTIFDKIKLPYDELRTRENPIKPIVDYYKSKLKPGEELWWMDNQTEIGGLKLRFWNNISKEEKHELLVLGMILFPEIFGKSQDKFNRFAFWLVTKHNIVCPNARDPFTAGGTRDYNVGSIFYTKVPRIFLNLFDSISAIVDLIIQIPAIQLSEYWQIKTTEKRKLNDWIDLVSQNGARIKPKGDLNLELILKQLVLK